ncbi:MAG TPA: hypothetical protein GYA09_04200 [Firmicutes bacterium]|nr:hypothetical protein [Candidatus Fermentithermobacillaceae bacterium]
MRRTRKKKQKVSSGIVKVLVLAVVMVGLGYATGKYFLASWLERGPFNGAEPEGTGTSQEPVPPPDEEPPPGDSTGNSTASAQVTLKPLSMHIAQLGAYSTREYADRAVNMAIEKGVSAAVISPDPLYRVLCCITGSRDSASRFAGAAKPKLLGLLKEDEHLYVTTFDVESKTFTIPGDQKTVEAVKQAFEAAEKAMASLIDFWDSYYLGSQIKADLSAVQKDIESAKASLEKVTPDSDAEPFHSKALAVIVEIEKAIEEAKKVQGNPNASPVNAMIQFIKTVDTYNQKLKDL